MFAVMMFFVSFIVLLLLRRLILLINPFSYIPRLRFIASLIDVVLYLLTFVVATLTLMVTLYIAGEILALAFVVIVLMGIIWALKETLPMFVEQIKLLLGYGPVRQGERVLYAGIPWQVESIGIYSYLSNALLTGGKVRLPIRDLIDMRSRPYDKNERWFPCQEGDYILINHTKWRKVIQQTAESIKFEWFGMEETMPTAQFLAQKIFNLSNTSFWVGINLHIAYEHRLEIMPDIISQFTELLETEFKQLPYGNSLLQPWIAFAGMNDTSLSLMAWVQLKSEAAAYYEDAKLDLTKISLQAANHYAWEIKRFHTIQQRDTQPDISIQSPLPLGAEG